LLASAVAQLPEQERQVLVLYYFNGMTLAEVGMELNVSESRACQVHTKALLRLRSRLDEPDVATARPPQSPA
jgi:RNA polymerase sigma factor for flagellar operon FliA